MAVIFALRILTAVVHGYMLVDTLPQVCLLFFFSIFQFILFLFRGINHGIVSHSCLRLECFYRLELPPKTQSYEGHFLARGFIDSTQTAVTNMTI